jgi:putative phosphoesterase
MRVAVLSDIHANIQALEAVLRDCETQLVDMFWLLGDYVDYGAAAQPVVKMLEALNTQYVISGNHDACLYLPDVRPSATPHGKQSFLYTKQRVESNPDAFLWLENIADTPMMMIPDTGIMLVHGTVNDPYWGKFTCDDDEQAESIFKDMEKQDVDLLFLGHSHVSFKLTKANRVIINPGSVGQPRNGISDAQYAIFEDGDIEFRCVPYDIEAAAADIRAARLPDYLWQRLFLGA